MTQEHLDESQATRVRYEIVLICTVSAFLLYLDRVCLGEVVKSQLFLSDFDLTKEEIGRFLGAFFFSYALCQVPAGWCSDRFGARRMLTIYIIGWSVMTGLTGFMTGLTGLIFARLGCGVAQAGAYPTISATIRRWIRFARRGQASSLVSFGGRMGGTLAPLLTAVVMMWLNGWRETLWAYAAIGMGVAVVFWHIVRDTPALHPACNSSERRHIGTDADERCPQLADIPPTLWRCCGSRSLWLNSAGQFFVNVGWAYLITWLPTFLKESGMEDRRGALMVSIVLAMGMVGQPIGGWATDLAVRRLGLRIGRILPLSLASFVAAGAYFCCTLVDSVWGVLACCAVVSLMTDIGNPSIWAFMQDVGGRDTGTIFGWANMWGNLGAALSSVMVPTLMIYGQESGNGQQLVFYACATAFLIAGLAALGMDATRPLTPEDSAAADPPPRDARADT